MDNSGSEGNPKSSDGGNRLALIALIFGLVTNAIGQSLLFTVLGPAIRKIGMNEVQAGLIITISALVVTLSSPFWGRRADSWGRKPVFLVGLTSYALTSFVFALVLHGGLNGFNTASITFMLLIGVRVIYAFLTAGINPAAMAYMADSTDAEARSAGMSLLGASFGIGAVIGPVLGSMLASISLLLPVFSAAGLALVGAFIALWALHDSPRREIKPKSGVLKANDRRIVFFLLAYALSFVSFSAMQQSVAFFLQDLLELNASATAQHVGIAMASMAIMMLVMQIGLVQILKPSPRLMLLLGAPISAVGLILLAIANSFGAVVMAHLIMGVGFGLFFPGTQASASLAVPQKEQGAVGGLIGASAAAGYIFGPLLGTGLYTVNYRLPYVVCALIMSLVFILTVCGIRKIKTTVMVQDINENKIPFDES